MHDDRRMGWAPHAQMIAEALPAAPKAKPPALVRRSATEFKIDGCVVHSSDIRHAAAQRHFGTSGCSITAAAVSSMFDALYDGAWPKADPGVIDAIASRCVWHERVPSIQREAECDQVPAAEPEWIEWAGGPCPVSPGTRVEVRTGCENIVAPPDLDLSCPTKARAWLHSRGLSNIVAYRILSEPSAPKDDADGWVAWDGGESWAARPVANGTRVKVRCRNGVTFEFTRPELVDWRQRSFPHDIVAYRVLP